MTSNDAFSNPVKRSDPNLPSRPSNVNGVIAWSRSEGLMNWEIRRWWLGIAVFIVTVSVLLLLQLTLLGSSGFWWFIGSLVTIGCGMFVHQTLRDKQRIQEMLAHTEHNLNLAQLVGQQVNKARGLSGKFMSLVLPMSSQQSDSTVVTLHPQYLMLNQFEQDTLQLAWASEIERIEPRRAGIGSTAESHSTFSSTSTYSGTASGDYAYGSGSSSGQSHGKTFHEDVYNHKIVITTHNPAHPLITLDFLEDEQMWDFSRAALQQMTSGTAAYDQAQVHLQAPEFNRNISDLRRWFSGDGQSPTWSQMSIPMKMGTIAFGIMLLACLSGPIMQYVLGVAVLPALALTFPLTLVGFSDAVAAVMGLVFVLGVVGCVSFVPALRETLDGLLQKKPLRPVLATAISWPVLGQLGLCGMMLAARPHANPKHPQQVEQQAGQQAEPQAGQGPGAKLAAAKPAPKKAIEAALADSESDWKKLLTPGSGWQAQVTNGVQVSPAQLVVVDAPAEGSEFVFVVESLENVTSRGVFRGNLQKAGMGKDQHVELQAVTDKDVGPAWPVDYLHSTLTLRRDGEQLQGNYGLVVHLDKPVKPVLWNKVELKKKVREAFVEGTQWSGYEKPASQAAIDARLTVTQVKNDGQSVEVLATADKYPLAAAVYTGQIRDSGIGLWGFPVIVSKQGADSPLSQESGSGLLFYGESHVTVGWRTDGKMIVVAHGVPFIHQPRIQLPGFQPTPVRNLASFSTGSTWKGSLQHSNDPAEDVTLTVTEVRNDGAYVRLHLARDAAPHGVEILVGKLDPERAGYSLTLQRKQAAAYLQHFTDLRMRIDPQDKCVGSSDRGFSINLARVKNGARSIKDQSTQAVSGLLKQMFSQSQKYHGTLTKASDGSSAKVAVDFTPKPGGGNIIQASVSIPDGPKGRILFEGPLVTTDEAVNGYCLMMKKKSAGAAEATSQIFNHQTDVNLWFRLDLDQKRLWGITGGDEFLLIEP